MEIKKLQELIKKYTKDIQIKNINIIFNKYSNNSLDKEILKNVFKYTNILGTIKYSSKIDKILNTGKIIKINSIRKDLLKITENLLKENKGYGIKYTK